jgi:hypothetical protein
MNNALALARTNAKPPYVWVDKKYIKSEEWRKFFSIGYLGNPIAKFPSKVAMAAYEEGRKAKAIEEYDAV